MGFYDTETVLQLNIDKSSLSQTAKNIAGGLNKAISGVSGQFSAGKAGKKGLYDEGFETTTGKIAHKAGELTSGLRGMFGKSEEVEVSNWKNKKEVFGKGKKKKDDSPKMLGGILKALGPIGLIVAIIKEIWQFISPIFKLLGMVLLIFMIPFFKAIKPFLKDLPEKLNPMLDFLKGIFEGIISFVAGFLSDPVKAVGDLVFGGLEFFVNGIMFFGEKLIGVIKSFVPEDLKDAFQTFVDVVSGIGGEYLDVLTGKKSPIEAIGNIVGIISEALGLEETWNKITSVIDNIGEDIFGKEIWDGFKSVISFIQDKIFNEEGIWAGIKEVIDFIGDSIFGEGI